MADYKTSRKPRFFRAIRAIFCGANRCFGLFDSLSLTKHILWKNTLCHLGHWPVIVTSVQDLFFSNQTNNLTPNSSKTPIRFPDSLC